MPNVTVACLHAWCIEQSTSRWLIHLQQIPFCKFSLDSFIEGNLFERCTATEVPTSYSRKENFVKGFALVSIPDSRVTTSERRGVALQSSSLAVQWAAWEILVGSVKKILHSLAGERTLDDEAIHSLLVEIENIPNNRPLTPVSDHPQDLSVLTPASLLTGTLDSSLPADVFIEADGFRRSWRAIAC